MKWITNIPNPKQPESVSMMLRGLNGRLVKRMETNERWLSDKLIGDPKPTESQSVEELKRQNIVGIYTTK